MFRVYGWLVLVRRRRDDGCGDFQTLCPEIQRVLGARLGQGLTRGMRKECLESDDTGLVEMRSAFHISFLSIM